MTAALRIGKRTEALIAGVIVAGVYLLTLAQNHSELEDSLLFADRIRIGHPADLFEGPHLIYDWVGRLAYEVVRTLGISEDPVPTLQVLDALLGGATIGVLWLALRRVGLSRLVAFTATGLLASSYSFWRNDVDIEVYALAGLAFALMFAAALRAIDRRDTWSFALLGLAQGALVLTHFAGVLLAGMAIAALLMIRPSSRAEWMRLGGAYAATASAMVVAGYALAIAVVGIHSPHEFREWFSESYSNTTTGVVSLKATVEAAVSAARGLVGGHFLLRLPSVDHFVQDHFSSKPLREERYMVADWNIRYATLLAGLAVAAAVLFVVVAVRWLRRPTLPPAARQVAILSVVWLIPTAAITAYWSPANIELWYSSWIPACILLALPLASADAQTTAARVLPVALVGCVFLVNLLGSQLPQRDKDRDYWRARSAWYVANTRPDDLILSNGSIETYYLKYLTPAQVKDVEGIARVAPLQGLAPILRNVAQTKATVYVTDEAFFPYRDAPGGCAGDQDVCDSARLMRAALLARAKRVPSGGPERIWVLPRPGQG